MSAFSNGAFSQDGAFSSGAFDFGIAPPVTPSEPPRGQIPWLARAPQRSREDLRKSRVLHGLEAEVVSKVAERQAENLGLDELQRKEELLAEMRLARLEANSIHFEELARQREELIDAEIAKRLRAIMQADEDAAAMFIMLGAIL